MKESDMTRLLHRQSKLDAPPAIACLVFDMYAANRYVSSHGAVVYVGTGHCGLVAGCGFAVHILKTHFEDLSARMKYAIIRIYVDDITLTVRALGPEQAVRKMSIDLPICQAALKDKNQESNQGKEQAYSSNSAVLKLWKAMHPAYPGKITMQAGDLGITQRPVHRKKPSKTC